MKVVIAGGTGFLGRALSQSLAADGHEVVAADAWCRRSNVQDRAVDAERREWTVGVGD